MRMTMICPSCGKEIQEPGEVCPDCGAALSPSSGAQAAAETAAGETTAGEMAQPLAAGPLAEQHVEQQVEQRAAIALRRASKFTATFTRMEVFIDDRKVGNLMTGEQQQFEVQPGPHTLYIRLDSFKSPKVNIDLGAGEILRLVCSPKMLGWGVSLTRDKG